MQEIDYSRFAANPDYDRLHLTEISNMLTHGGLHDSSYIETFVREKLQTKGVHTFGDLLVQGQEQHPDLFQRYRLTVIVSDITQGRIVRLPHDAHLYGIDPNALDVARAVRMSASIPFFFIPLQLTDANGIQSCIVDGGLLSNFPLFLFEHTSIIQENALPTFGFQLVNTSQQSVFSTGSNMPCGIDMLKALMHTMLSAHDKLYINDEAFAHTIAIPTYGISSTQFTLTKEQVQQLYEGGKAAAAAFFKTWNFEAYLATYRRGNNPIASRQTQVHQAMKQYAQGYSSCKDV